MGYTNNTGMSQFIAAGKIEKTAGTWTPTVASNVVSDVRTATAAAFTLLIPVELPSNSAYHNGALLKSVDVFYKIATAAATDVATVELEKVTLPATGTGVTGAAVTGSCDSGHDTAAKRKAVGDHTLTFTVTNPVWVTNGDACYLQVVVDAAATTAFTLFGARANYTLRV